MSAYLKFRLAMFSCVHNNLNLPTFEERLQRAIEIWPEEVRPQEYRLLTYFYWANPDLLLDYCHLRQSDVVTPPPSSPQASIIRKA